MKKTHLFILCTFLLISCSNINSNVPKIDSRSGVINPFKSEIPILFKSGLSELCSEPDKNINQYAQVIKVPDIVMPDFNPPKEEWKQIENTSAIGGYDIAVLKNNMFIAAYNYPESYGNKLVAKIFNQSGEEIVNRFVIADYNAFKFKVITHKNLDYFFIVYEVINEQKDNKDLFIKKFDLKGNKLNEIKIEDYLIKEYYYSNQKDISFSLDENGNNLILSWVNLEYSHTALPPPCPQLQNCLPTLIVPPKYYHPVVKMVNFDEKMNYCVTRLGINMVIENNFNLSQSYITLKRDKVIFPINYEKIIEIDIKNKSFRNVSLESNITDDKNRRLNYTDPIIINEDDNHDLYFANYSNIYKTDSNLKVINSKTVSEVKEIEPDKYIEGQEVDPNKFENPSLRYFFNKDLDLYRYKNDVYPIKDFTLKLGDKLLVVGRYSYFKILDSL